MKRPLVLSSFLFAVAGLGLQLLGMLTLPPATFGAFSVLYLISALTSSVALSVLLDPWAGARVANPQLAAAAFPVVLLGLGAAGGSAAGVAGSMLTGDLAVGALSGAAVLAAAYRAGCRYRAVVERNGKEMLLSDALAVAPTLVGAVAVAAGAHLDLVAFITVWAAGSAISALGFRAPRRLHPRVLGRWVRQEWPRIRALLADSSLMDLGAIGTPYVVGAVAGLGALGVYRGISNVAAPVRLVLDPLRPLLPRATMTLRRWGFIVGISIAFGGGAWLALTLIGEYGWQLGTLSALAPLAMPTALFVTASGIGHASYLVARGRATARTLIVSRVLQTVLAVALPVGGALGYGVAGAGWGLAIATSLSSAAWFAVAARSTAAHRRTPLAAT